jgi:pyruvate dehydrogenase E1 component alpha subunit
MLKEFEKEIADLFKAGKIRTPVHLSGGNEDALSEIFKHYRAGDDWIFSTWRNHYHWILSGRDPDVLKDKILTHSSMHVYDDKFFTSAIVGGIAPIAVGVAYELKRLSRPGKVYCFLGDMGASTGIAMESMRFACGHQLPIQFVIEDNGLSVKTDTRGSWGCKDCSFWTKCGTGQDTLMYRHHRQWPHAGTGEKVLF